MTIYHPERQYVLTDVVEIDYDELTTGVAANAIKLPVNAVVLGGGAFVHAADSASTTLVYDVGDGDTGDLYVTDLDGKTANESEQFDVTEIGKKYPSGGWITVTRAVTGSAPTAGTLRVWVTYAVIGRMNEAQT